MVRIAGNKGNSKLIPTESKDFASGLFNVERGRFLYWQIESLNGMDLEFIVRKFANNSLKHFNLARLIIEEPTVSKKIIDEMQKGTKSLNQLTKIKGRYFDGKAPLEGTFVLYKLSNKGSLQLKEGRVDKVAETFPFLKEKIIQQIQFGADGSLKEVLNLKPFSELQGEPLRIAKKYNTVQKRLSKQKRE